MAKHGIGLIGCGRMGHVWTNTVNPHADAEIVAVYDPDPAAAACLAARAGAAAADSVEALLGAAGVDVALICTPTHTHVEIVDQAAAAGCHVLCEKPMALTLAGCRAMQASCEQAGVTLVIGQTLRFWGAFYELRQRVAAGAIGHPCLAQVLRGGARSSAAAPVPAAASADSRRWRYDTRFSGGDVLEGVLHELDFTRSLLGEVASATATITGRQEYAGRLSPTMIQAVLDFEDGGQATVRMGGMVGFAGGSNWVAGTEGTLTFDRWDGPVALHCPGADEPQAFASSTVSAYTRELDDALHAMDTGETPENSAANGWRNIGLGLALYRSIETGQRIEFADGLPLGVDESYQYRGPSAVR
jgi:predicted dehydrogenase